MMKESEARKKWCPFSHFSVQTKTQMFNCITSDCMAWKFDRPKKTFLGFTDEEWVWIDNWIIDERFTPNLPTIHEDLRVAAAFEIRKRNITVPTPPNSFGECQMLKRN